jgi:hypothetical protein
MHFGLRLWLAVCYTRCVAIADPIVGRDGAGTSATAAASQEVYVVVVKHLGLDSIERHLDAVSAGIPGGMRGHVQMLFPHLAELNVHAYVTSSEAAVEAMRGAPTVEYIERVLMYSVLPIEEGSEPIAMKDEPDFKIQDFSKIPLTTFLSSDSACTISYEHFRDIANIPEASLPMPKSVYIIIDLLSLWTALLFTLCSDYNSSFF